jgi:anti-sigma-K factor RskA
VVVDMADRRTRRSTINGWLAGVAAAAVLVAAGLGISTYQASQRADEAQLAAEQITSVLANPNAVVERTQVAGGGTGTLVVAPDEEQAVFLAASLPNTESGETYQLWAIDEAGATSVGLLQPDAGRATALVDLPAGTTTFGMTVEPAGGSEAPTTDPVLLVELST